MKRCLLLLLLPSRDRMRQLCPSLLLVLGPVVLDAGRVISRIVVRRFGRRIVTVVLLLLVRNGCRRMREPAVGMVVQLVLGSVRIPLRVGIARRGIRLRLEALGRRGRRTGGQSCARSPYAFLAVRVVVADPRALDAAQVARHLEPCEAEVHAPTRRLTWSWWTSGIQ